MKKSFFFVFILVFVNHGFSQLEDRLSIGGGYTSNAALVYPTGESFNTHGVNLRIAANVFNHQILVAGFSYYLPVNVTFTTTAYNKNYGAPNYSTDFLYNDNISTSEFFVEICNVIGKDNTDKFGFYFHTGFNWMLLKEKINYMDLDTLNFKSEIKESTYSFSSINLYVGPGIQFRLKDHILFLEAKLNMPVLANKGSAFYRRIYYAGFTLGYRFSFEDF